MDSLLEDLASDRLASNSTGMIFVCDMILDGTQISSGKCTSIYTYGAPQMRN